MIRFKAMLPTRPLRSVLAACAALAALALYAPALAAAAPEGHAPALEGSHGGSHGGGHGGGHGDGHAADPSAHFNWFDIGYKGKDASGGTLEEGEEEMSPPFAFMLLNFGVVVFILLWKARPALLGYTARRHDTIKAALEEAGKLREAARAKLDEYTAQIEKAEKDIEAMVAEIRKGAEAEKERILADAEAEAEAMKRDAERRIAAEIDRARAALEREVVAAAAAVAERLIREHASQDDQTQLVNGFIQDVQKQAEHPATTQS